MSSATGIVKSVNAFILSEAINPRKPVVVIDGYAGSGKTTITKQLGKINKDILPMHLDDFIKHWRVRKRLIENAKNPAEVFEKQWYRFDELTRVIRAFKRGKKQVTAKLYDYDKNDFVFKTIKLNKKILVIDGIFLLHPEHKFSKLIDLKVYLEIGFSKGDKRRLNRDKKRFGKNFQPDDHPDNWVRHFKKAYQGYVKKYKPAKLADLVIEFK